MNRSEIFTEIETALTELNIFDKRFGDKLIGVECSPYLSKHFGQKWDVTADQLLAGEISDEEFLNVRIDMIEEYKKFLLRQRLETKLVDAYSHQIGTTRV